MYSKCTCQFRGQNDPKNAKLQCWSRFSVLYDEPPPPDCHQRSQPFWCPLGASVGTRDPWTHWTRDPSQMHWDTAPESSAAKSHFDGPRPPWPLPRSWLQEYLLCHNWANGFHAICQCSRAGLKARILWQKRGPTGSFHRSWKGIQFRTQVSLLQVCIVSFAQNGLIGGCNSVETMLVIWIHHPKLYFKCNVFETATICRFHALFLYVQLSLLSISHVHSSFEKG